MSLILPLAQDIVYSSIPTDIIFMTTVQLIAIATHPTFTYFLYALYGLGVTTANITTYTGYQLQVWNASSTTHDILYNMTLANSMNCSQRCEIEVSDNLLLIEDPSTAYVYELYNSTKLLVNTKASAIKSKSTSQLRRHIAVYGKYCVTVNNIDLLVEEYNITNVPTATPSFTVLNNYTLDYSNKGPVIDVLFTSNFIMWAANVSNLQVSYVCFPCLINSQNVSNFPIIDTGIPGNGANLSEGYNGTNHMLWISTVTSSHLYVIDNSNFTALLQLSNTVLMASCPSLAFLRSSGIYISKTYSNYNTSMIYTFLDAGYFMGVVSYDCTFISWHNYSTTYAISQGQIVSECSNYYAYENNSFCTCETYSGLFCQTKTQTSQESQQGETGIPMGAIIGGAAAGGMVVLAITSYALYKKVFSKASKRTPYVYIQTELMSFEV